MDFSFIRFKIQVKIQLKYVLNSSFLVIYNAFDVCQLYTINSWIQCKLKINTTFTIYSKYSIYVHIYVFTLIKNKKEKRLKRREISVILNKSWVFVFHICIYISHCNNLATTWALWLFNAIDHQARFIVRPDISVVRTCARYRQGRRFESHSPQLSIWNRKHFSSK